ncbi:stalk domain-containing protein [Acetivibrio saccincola]|uniref:Uncharacterized protein n=1 Tax=Acetivibrio saccincola TaxID=1677857 RepID=A0A2K9EP50_9FIRM|nr:stalk domain-containing protein [Acetivibrio saccincola]AUG58401.1 hypothetical protein HVS_12640 [Acetivibrio saccincola]
MSMRKIILLTIIVSLVFTSTLPAYSAIMVNPFFAISSNLEYQEIKENLKDGHHMYFQWGRLARNNEGIIQFTDKMYFGISPYDNRTEYGFPTKISAGGHFEYIVQPGDSLFSISRKFEIPHFLIAEYNELEDSNLISAGSSLKIPKTEPDLSSKHHYKEAFPNGKALLSIYFDAEQYKDNKNAAIEFLNMDNHSWDKYIIQPIIDTVNNYQFDGVVLDFEAFRDSFNTGYYSTSQRTGLKEKYNSFIKRLKDALKDKLLIVIVHPTNVGGYFDGYDIAQIEKISDYIILMAYDYQYVQKYTDSENVPAGLHGKVKTIESSYNNQPYVQPFWKVEEAVVKLLEIVENPQNVLLGVSIVGMEWVKYKRNVGGKDYFYYELNRPELSSIEMAGSKEEFLDEPVIYRKIVPSNKISNEKRKELIKDNGDVLVEIEYHFETPESLYLKYYNIVKNYNLSGLTVWRLGKGSSRVWEGLLKMFPLDEESDNENKNENVIDENNDKNNEDNENDDKNGIEIILKIGQKYMTVNGEVKEIDPGRDTTPVIINDRTLVPIRAIIESVGGEIFWDGEKKKVTVEYKDIEIEMVIDSKEMLVNQKTFINDVAPQIINGRTYMPLRFLLENLGFNVEWDGAERTVNIFID